MAVLSPLALGLVRGVLILLLLFLHIRSLGLQLDFGCLCCFGLVLIILGNKGLFLRGTLHRDVGLLVGNLDGILNWLADRRGGWLEWLHRLGLFEHSRSNQSILYFVMVRLNVLMWGLVSDLVSGLVRDLVRDLVSDLVSDLVRDLVSSMARIHVLNSFIFEMFNTRFVLL